MRTQTSPRRTGTIATSRHRLGRFPLLAGLVAVALVAASCGSGGTSTTTSTMATPNDTTDPGTPTPGGTLRVLARGEHPTLDPVKAAISVSASPGVRLYSIYSALVYPTGAEAEMRTGLAESLTTTDAGTTWTMKLRPGVLFSDGTVFDAAAVKFNWDRVADAANASPSLSYMNNNIQSYDVVDPLTLQIVLKKIDSQFPRAVAGPLTYIGSPTAIQKDPVGFGNAPVGAGPFTLKEWVRNAATTLVRNPTYWDAPRPYVDELIITPIVDETGQRLRAFQAGEGDVMLVTDQISTIDKAVKAGGGAVRVPHAVGSGLMMNTRIPGLDDQRVREAIGLALDREAILKVVYDEDGEVAGMFGAGTPFYDPANDYPARDLNKAQELIDAWVATSGHDLNLVYSGIAGGANTTRYAEVIKSQLEELDHVHIEISLVDVATLLADNNAGRAQLGQLAVQGPWPDPALYNQFYSSGLQNNIGYDSPQADAAFDAAHATESLPDQYAAYKDVAAQILQDMVFIPTRHSVYAVVYQPNVVNVQTYSDSGLLTDQVWLQH